MPTYDHVDAEPNEADADNGRRRGPLYWLSALALAGVVIAVVRYYDLERYQGKLIMLGVVMVASVAFYGGRAIVRRQRRDRE